MLLPLLPLTLAPLAPQSVAADSLFLTGSASQALDMLCTLFTKPGDTIFVTGYPGARALGLKLIQAGENSGIDGGFADAWRRPDARMDVGMARKGGAGAVERGHQVHDAGEVFAGNDAAFLRGGDRADAQGLREVEQVARLRLVVALEVWDGDGARDRQSENRLRTVDAVSAGEADARFGADGAAAFEHACGDFLGNFTDGPSQDGNGYGGGPAHGVDVADGIGGGDASEVEGIVYDGHEEVGRADERGPIAKVDDRGVVPAVVAHEEVGCMRLRMLGVEDFIQDGGGNFASAACAVAELCEFYFADYHLFSLRFCGNVGKSSSQMYTILGRLGFNQKFN